MAKSKFNKSQFFRDLIREFEARGERPSRQRILEIGIARMSGRLPKGVELRIKDVINASEDLSTEKKNLKKLENEKVIPKPVDAVPTEKVELAKQEIPAPNHYSAEEIGAAIKFLKACGNSVVRANDLLRILIREGGL